MPARKSLTPQYAAPQATDPYYGDYSALAQQFLKTKNHPVYSAGQGIADVLGDVGEAYFDKKALDKAKTEQGKDFSATALAAQFANDPGLATTPEGSPVSVSGRDNAAMARLLTTNPQQQPGMPAGQGNPGMKYGQVSMPSDMASAQPATPQQRQQIAMHALDGASPQAKLSAMPGIQEMAQQFAPQAGPTLEYGKMPTVRLPDGTIKPAVPQSVMDTLSPAPTDFEKLLLSRGVQRGTPEWNKSISDEQARQTYIPEKDPLNIDLKRSEIEKNKADAADKTQKSHLLDDIPEGVTGPAVLDLLKPVERAQIESIVNGDQAVPSGRANPSAQRISGLVALADPTYTAQRIKVKQDFSSGTTAQNIKRIGTAIGHVDSLMSAMDKLGNYGGIASMANSSKNAIAGATGQGAIRNVNLKADAVATELEAAFRGAGTSITGIHEWRKNVSSNLSPEAQQSVKDGALELLDSRLDASANQWNQVMPANLQRDGLSFLSPKQREIYAKLKGDAAAGSQGDAAPHPQDIVDELRKRGVVK